MKLFLLAMVALVRMQCTNNNQPPVTWQTIEKSLQTQLITAADGDTIHLPEGHFMFTNSITLDGKKNILIRQRVRQNDSQLEKPN